MGMTTRNGADRSDPDGMRGKNREKQSTGPKFREGLDAEPAARTHPN